MHTLIAVGSTALWLYAAVAVLASLVFSTQALEQTFYNVAAVIATLVN
jgi:hypothetical protein